MKFKNSQKTDTPIHNVEREWFEIFVRFPIPVCGSEKCELGDQLRERSALYERFEIYEARPQRSALTKESCGDGAKNVNGLNPLNYSSYQRHVPFAQP